MRLSRLLLGGAVGFVVCFAVRRTGWPLDVQLVAWALNVTVLIVVIDWWLAKGKV